MPEKKGAIWRNDDCPAILTSLGIVFTSAPRAITFVPVSVLPGLATLLVIVDDGTEVNVLEHFCGISSLEMFGDKVDGCFAAVFVEHGLKIFNGKRQNGGRFFVILAVCFLELVQDYGELLDVFDAVLKDGCH